VSVGRGFIGQKESPQLVAIARRNISSLLVKGMPRAKFILIWLFRPLRFLASKVPLETFNGNSILDDSECRRSGRDCDRSSAMALVVELEPIGFGLPVDSIRLLLGESSFLKK